MNFFGIFCIFLKVKAYRPLRVGLVEEVIDVCALAHVRIYTQGKKQKKCKFILKI